MVMSKETLLQWHVIRYFRLERLATPVIGFPDAKWFSLKIVDETRLLYFHNKMTRIRCIAELWNEGIKLHVDKYGRSKKCINCFARVY